MKKILSIFFVLILTAQLTLAKSEDKNYSLKFNGEKFNLLYSVKNEEFGGYLNEYYKTGETYNIWSELVAIHHFPNAYSPIDRISEFKSYLSNMKVPSELTFDDKKNTAIIDFVMVADKQMPVVLEYNIFKYQKSKKCGTVAIQYARRYAATTTMQVEAVKRDFAKNRKKMISKVKNYGIPEIITKDIDKCISTAEIVKQSEPDVLTPIEETKENIATESTVPVETSEEQMLSEVTSGEIEQTTECIKDEAEKDNSSQTKEVLQDSLTVAEVQKNELSEELENKTEVVSEQKSKENETEVKSEKIIAEQAQTEPETVTLAEEKTLPVVILNTDKAEEKVIESETKPVVTQKEPVREADNSIKNVQPQKDERNEKKQYDRKESYLVFNTNYDYIATPRTAKELKEEVKRKRIEQERAKRLAHTPYLVINNNTDYIAVPRTKKEIKEHNKELKRKAKERAKQAKKKRSNI